MQPSPGARASPAPGPAEGDPPSRRPHLVHSTSCARRGLRYVLGYKKNHRRGAMVLAVPPTFPPARGREARPGTAPRAPRSGATGDALGLCNGARTADAYLFESPRSIGPGLPGPFHRGCERRLPPAPALWAPLCGVLLPFDVILELRRSAKGQAQRLCQPPRGVNATSVGQTVIGFRPGRARSASISRRISSTVSSRRLSRLTTIEQKRPACSISARAIDRRRSMSSGDSV